jgi:DNA-binding FrmR family transcriptional regulator
MDYSARINRIIGQLKGIQKMIDEQRECNEVLQQVSAVKKAIDSIAKELVTAEVCQYVPQKDIQKVQETIERVIST